MVWRRFLMSIPLKDGLLLCNKSRLMPCHAGVNSRIDVQKCASPSSSTAVLPGCLLGRPLALCLTNQVRAGLPAARVCGARALGPLIKAEDLSSANCVRMRGRPRRSWATSIPVLPAWCSPLGGNREALGDRGSVIGAGTRNR